MIRKPTDMTLDVREQMRGGAGTTEILNIVGGDELNHARLFSKITLPVGASIGEHTHLKETEYYYIIEGAGVVEEADGEKSVTSGDLVITSDGESHGIRNTGDTPLVFMAVIILDD